MSAIHYKFSSSNDYKNVTFDGLSISVQDCKKAIMGKEKLKMMEVDLLITNAQSLKDYREETDLIPKNTALLVRRIPFGATTADKSKVYIVKKSESAAGRKSGASYMSLDELRKTEDLVTANASELDKIKAMMSQSTTEYDPSKYLKPPKHGSYQRYDASTHSPYVKCFKCNQIGHYSTQCRLSKPVVERPKAIRPATGIPRSHMIQVNKEARGAMLTPDGQYVVPFIDKRGYEVGKKEKPPFLPEVKEVKEDDEDEPVPDELICLLCKEIMLDAVVIPCCGNSYCDECIRNALLESEDHECPTCHKKNISPDSLIANKFLRQAVNKFRNETGIQRKKTNVWPRPAPVEAKPTPPPQPTKIMYGPPKAKSQPAQTPATSGAYVVKARSAQVYAAQGYTVKKATNMMIPSSNTTTLSSTVTTSTPTTTEVTTPQATIKQETPVTSSDNTINSGSSTIDSVESTTTGVTGIQPLTPIKTEPKISPLNMMVERPQEDESPPPPPPPPLPLTEDKQPVIDPVPANPVEVSPLEPPPVSTVVTPPEDKPTEEPVAQPQVVAPLPSLLDDMPAHAATHFTIHPQGINITLKNAPPVQVKTETKPLIDPPMNLPPQTPFQRPSLLGSVPSMLPLLQQPPMNMPLPRMGAPGMQHIPVPPTRIPMNIPPPTGPMMRLHPPPMVRSSGPPMRMPTSLPPPGLAGMYRQNIAVPPPMRGLPPGMMPPMPFPPPLGIPPPSFLKQAPPTPVQQHEGQSVPPPPGTDTPPTIPVSTTVKDRRRKHSDERSSSRSKREGHNKENKSPSKLRKSKLAMMSDEFTREQKQKVAYRKRKPRRGRSESPSESDSFSSSSYSSSSSRSSSRSSYSSSGSSTFSSSETYTDSRSRSRTPARRRKKRENQKRVKKAESRSYTRSHSKTPRKRSASPSHKKRGKKVTTKHRKDSRSPAKRSAGTRRRRSRSADQGSPHRGSRYRSDRERRRRSRTPSRSRDRRKSDKRTKDESGIPGMPPQSILDYERDLALYDYYKQKYQDDWLRNRILPPSPFKRFINYNPTKIAPPTVQPQPVLRQLPPHPSLIQVQGHPQGHPTAGLFSQPPPPGDATPTEEDAGMFAYRDRTPDRFVVRQAPAPWDPPPFDGNLAERARLLQEEEYYASMQNKLRHDVGWTQNQRGFPEPLLRFDPRARSDARPQGGERARYGDERRRRGRTPPVERGGRGSERDQERFSSRNRRREIEDSSRITHRDSRDKERDRGKDPGVKRREVQKDSRSSRRDDDPRVTKKRGRDYGKREGESSRGDSRSKKRIRGTRRTETPDSIPTPEPIPPGEGDGTPVRDESRIEFSNESIKVKVINDKVKPKSDKRRDRNGTTSRVKEEGKPPNSRREEKQSVRREKPRREEDRVLASNQEEKTDIPVVAGDQSLPPDGAKEPTFERSPTPTLDENVSPLQAAESQESIVPDVQTTTLVPAEQEPAPTHQVEESRKVEKTKEEVSKPVEHKRMKKPSRSTRVVTKTKPSQRASPTRDSQYETKDRMAASIKGDVVRTTVPKSRWESDEESGSQNTEKPKVSPKSHLHENKHAKSRKIRIKKPGNKSSTHSRKEAAPRRVSADKTEHDPKLRVKGTTENSEQKQKPPVMSDSRRVIVSSSNSTEKHSVSKSTRSLRPSISTIDEATFEPDYNDDDSEKAISNYAPSDFEDNDREPKNGEKSVNDRKEALADDKSSSQDEVKEVVDPPKGQEEESLEENNSELQASAAERSDDGFEKSRKKRKKKKKKHRRHHHHEEDEPERRKDDASDEEIGVSESEEDKYEHRPSESSARRHPASNKHPKHENHEHGSHSGHSRSKKDRRHSEKGRKSRRYDDGTEKAGNRKRKSERDLEEEYSEEEEERRPKKRSQRSPVGGSRKEKRRERDEHSLEDDDYSDEGPYRSPTPEERRKHKSKKQKHKKMKKESTAKEVRTVASRIQRSR